MGEKETATSEEAERQKQKTKSNQSNDRLGQGDGRALDPDSDDDGVEGGSSEAAINSSHSNIKNLREGGGGGGDAVEAAINNTKSNIKNREGMLVDDDFQRPEIAIGDPGVNGNIAGDSQGIAVSDEGVPADKPTKTS